MIRFTVLLALAACSPETTITVDVEDADEIAMVEVVDQAAWAGEADSDEGYYDSAEAPALPVVFDVPAGDYTVVIAQGACNKTTDVTVNPNENVDVVLALECSE